MLSEIGIRPWERGVDEVAVVGSYEAEIVGGSRNILFGQLSKHDKS